MAAVMYIYYRRHYAGADAGFRVRGGRKWRIQDFSEVLKVRPHTKSGGGGGGGGFRSDIRKVGGGGRFRSDIRKVGGGGGGGGASGPIYEKWRGGRFRFNIRKVGGGGHSASGPIPLRTQKISTCTYLRAT